MADAYKAKVKEFDAALNREVKIDPGLISKLSFRGIPEGEGRRSAAWRILLNFLPDEKCRWKEELFNRRNAYKQFLNDIILKSPVTADDHPLNPNPESSWQGFFKDNEVLLQIDKDVRRLCPDISFFSQATLHPNPDIVGGNYERLHERVQQTNLNSRNIERKGLGMAKLSLIKQKALDLHYAPLPSGSEAHWEVVERILFLYAKLNPGQSYVQGMNEIIGPIYYVLATDPRPDWRMHAEADCFYCFTNLMSDIRDFFIKTLDDAESGVKGVMTGFMRRLSDLDPKCHTKLQSQDLKPQYFAFRWLSLMLSQEFPLPDVLRIWDSLLSDSDSARRRKFLIDVCVAMVTLVRDEILSNDFAENMKLLQNYPSIDVQIILSKAASFT